MLTIKDLSMSKELDAEAMKTVSGGVRALAPSRSFFLGDFQNSFNTSYLTSGLYYAPDYSVDVLEQSNVGVVDASGNFGSVVLPQLSQSNGGANG
jgi:hypothetical protein